MDKAKFKPIADAVKAKGWDATAAFKSFDKNSDGLLDKGEFTSGISTLKVALQKADIDELFKQMDAGKGVNQDNWNKMF